MLFLVGILRSIAEEAFAFFGITCNDKPQKATELLRNEKLELQLNSFDKIAVNIPANNGVILKFKI